MAFSVQSHAASLSSVAYCRLRSAACALQTLFSLQVSCHYSSTIRMVLSAPVEEHCPMRCQACRSSRMTVSGQV